MSKLREIVRRVIKEELSIKSGAVLYFKDKKPKKVKNYNSAFKAHSDYEHDGCIYAQVFDKNGKLLSSYPKNGKELAYGLNN